MMGSAGKMPRQTRPAGPGWPVDEEWKLGIRRDMKLAGISQAEMARQIHCSDSALSKLWLPTTRESRLVGPIHRVLGRPPPSTLTDTDDALRRINARWTRLSKAQRELVESLVEQLILQKP